MSGAMGSLPEALAHDWRNLADLIEAVGERQPVPCRDGRGAPPEAWTSEDAEMQRRAALACQRCPALGACRAYGLTHLKEAGVYGGLTESERTTHARPDRKENANA